MYCASVNIEVFADKLSVHEMFGYILADPLAWLTCENQVQSSEDVLYRRYKNVLPLARDNRQLQDDPLTVSDVLPALM